MGASAIGTGINVDLQYFVDIVPAINHETGLELTQAQDLIDATNNLDSLVEVSSALKNLAVNLSKISNDLRLMSSGPKTMVPGSSGTGRSSGAVPAGGRCACPGMGPPLSRGGGSGATFGVCRLTPPASNWSCVQLIISKMLRLFRRTT